MQPRAMGRFDRAIEMEAGFLIAVFCTVQTRLVHRVIGRFGQSFPAHHVNAGDDSIFVHRPGNEPCAFAFTSPSPPLAHRRFSPNPLWASLERQTGSYQLPKPFSDDSFTNFFRRTPGCKLELCLILHSWSTGKARRKYNAPTRKACERVQEKPL